MSTDIFLSAFLAADPDRREAALRVLRGDVSLDACADGKRDRVLSRADVARIMRVSTRTVTNYARRGVIRQLRFGGKGCRASGFSALSVEAALAAGGGAR